MTKKAYLIANFGGPRSLDEVYPFLKALLTDQDVVRTNFPAFLHRLIFSRAAKKRSKKILKDYNSIGGKSPIFADTEALADELRKRLNGPVTTFHRYIPATHQTFLNELKHLNVDEIHAFPMFPQFTYATTGSIARWFDKHLPQKTSSRIRWVKSYPETPSFIQAHRKNICAFMEERKLKEEDIILLFSAHGIPETFVASGDPYEEECRSSFEKIMAMFPKALGRLAYQSKFGPGEWIKPYTIDVCREILQWNKGRKHVLFVPISFTSDHIETLYEIEQEYLPVIESSGIKAHRVPALTLNSDWIHAIVDILAHRPNQCSNQMLIRSA